jgi:hypothetical protein
MKRVQHLLNVGDLIVRGNDNDGFIQADQREFLGLC